MHKKFLGVALGAPPQFCVEVADELEKYCVSNYKCYEEVSLHDRLGDEIRDLEDLEEPTKGVPEAPSSVVHQRCKVVRRVCQR